MKAKLLLTGASGFIGQNAIPILMDRYDIERFSFRTDQFDQLIFKDIQAVVFLSGLAHQSEAIAASEYDKVNNIQAVHLAKAAKSNHVNQFIFLSSVKVYGDNAQGPYDEDSACEPSDAYGTSKWKAEQNLLALANDTFKISIIRPPLVYGPGVKANMNSLVHLVKRWPILPFGNIQNKRSMVYTGNLVALIETLLHESRTGVFIAGDKSPHSTTELIQEVRNAMGVKRWIIPLPNLMQQLIRKVKPNIGSRLFDSFVIDNSSTNKRLDFSPEFSFREGVQKMVQANPIK